MLRKILSLVLNYDRITRVEKESTPRPETTAEAGGNPASRSQVSNRRMVSPSNEVQIPDPWD
tara:strand:+ start:155 stop:340 length:186 start_codon:yes stop_codon:yes gene_type:complete